MGAQHAGIHSKAQPRHFARLTLDSLEVSAQTIVHLVRQFILLYVAAPALWLVAGVAAANTNDVFLARYQPLPAPACRLLRPGDRPVICGDSITEQKMDSQASSGTAASRWRPRRT